MSDGTILSTKEELNLYEKTNNSLKRQALRRTTTNTKTGEIIDSKLELSPIKYKKESTYRTTKDGITTINGKIKATRTQEINELGDKIITVDYGQGKKIITITPDGKRTIKDNTPKFINL